MENVTVQQCHNGGGKKNRKETNVLSGVGEKKAGRNTMCATKRVTRKWGASKGGGGIRTSKNLLVPGGTLGVKKKKK